MAGSAPKREGEERCVWRCGARQVQGFAGMDRAAQDISFEFLLKSILGKSDEVRL